MVFFPVIIHIIPQGVSEEVISGNDQQFVVDVFLRDNKANVTHSAFFVFVAGGAVIQHRNGGFPRRCFCPVCEMLCKTAVCHHIDFVNLRNGVQFVYDIINDWFLLIGSNAFGVLMVKGYNLVA